MASSNAIAVSDFLVAARAQLYASNSGLDVPFTGTTAPAEPETVLGSGKHEGDAVHLGFVFGGGGAKGDFQLGAINSVYQMFQIESHAKPPPIDVLTGISVGSLAAVSIATSPYRGGRSKLNEVWSKIKKPSDIYVDGPLLSELRSLITQLSSSPGARPGFAGRTGFTASVRYPLGVPSLDGDISLHLLPAPLDSATSLKDSAAAAVKSLEQLLSDIVHGKWSQLLPAAQSLRNIFSPIPSVVGDLNHTTAIIQEHLSEIKATADKIPDSLKDAIQHLDPLHFDPGRALRDLNAVISDAERLPNDVAKVINDIVTKIAQPINSLTKDMSSIGGLIENIVKLSEGLVQAGAGLNLSPVDALVKTLQWLVILASFLVALGKLLTDEDSQIGLFSFQPLFQLLEAQLSATDVEAINRGSASVHIGFTGLESAAYRFADKSWTRDDLLTALRASVSIPVFFPAIPMSLEPTGGGTYRLDTHSLLENYVDGGVRSVVAVSPAINAMANSGDGSKPHLNVIIVYACSNLRQERTPGDVKGITNVLFSTLGAFELTQFADALLEADTGIRQAVAESNDRDFGAEFDYLAQHAKVVWSTGKPVNSFPSLFELTGREQDRGKPMPGDTIVILIEPDEWFDRYHSPFDFNGTDVSRAPDVSPGATMIEESMNYGESMARFVLTGQGSPRWSLLKAFQSGLLTPFDPLARAVS